MDRDFLIDLFADFGPVTIRRMFSGFGISVDGVNFALALRSGLFFRADEETIPRFAAEGSTPFQYQTRAKNVTVNSYWQLPVRLFDDSEELAEWARAALSAARRAALKKSAGARMSANDPGDQSVISTGAVKKKKTAKRNIGATAKPLGSSPRSMRGRIRR